MCAESTRELERSPLAVREKVHLHSQKAFHKTSILFSENFKGGDEIFYHFHKQKDVKNVIIFSVIHSEGN
jgi:hypothetical protein